MKYDTFDVQVIGAGLGGLSAAARLAQEGYRVAVIEQHYIPGGCATTFKRKDFIMEVGLHEMDGLHAEDMKQALFKKLDIFKYMTFKSLPEFYRVVSVDRKDDYTVPDAGMEKVITQLNAQFPDKKDQKAIRRFFNVIQGIYHQVSRFYRLTTLQRMLVLPFTPLFYPYMATYSNIWINILSKTNPLMWLFHPSFIFKRFHTLGSLLDTLSHNKCLKNTLCANLGYYHDDPYSMSLIFFSAAQASYFEGGGWFIKGGSQQLSNYLEKVIRDYGGTLLLGREVTNIITEGNRVVGIKYRNAHDRLAVKTTIYANVLIANAAPARVACMLPEEHGKKLKAKVVDRFTDACSLLSIYVGFKSHLANGVNKNGAYSTFIAQQGLHGSLKDTWATIKEQHPAERDFVFVDYSQIDSGLTTADKSVGVLCAVGYLAEWDGLSETDYTSRKDAVAQKMFAVLDKVIPGIADEIEYYEVGTPRTIASYTLNPSGSPYGFAQIPSQSGLPRMYRIPRLKNLYFSSAWSFPGGGFTGALLAGHETVRRIVRRHKPDPTIKKYVIHKQKTYEDKKTSSRLLARKTIARHTMELVFEKNEFLARFQPGQYAALRLVSPAYDALDMPLRLFSITSHPDEPVLRFAMRESHSAFKRSCLAMATGDQVHIYGPMGNFVLQEHPASPARNLVFLVSGIGITPVMPMLKDLEKHASRKNIYLIYTNKTKAETSYHEEIASMRLENLDYINRYTASQSRINAKFITTQLRDVHACDYYIVGNSYFIKAMQSIVAAQGVPEAQVYVDDFG